MAASTVSHARPTIPSDFGYSAHRRVVSRVSGVNFKERDVVFDNALILENRVNGVVRSVTVLNPDTGRAIERIQGWSARY